MHFPYTSWIFTSILLILASFCAGESKQNSNIRDTPEIASTVSKNIFQSGTASWYGNQFQGKKTASGAPFDMNAFTAAHKTLPFGTIVRVMNLSNGNTVNVKINDRGPFTTKRIIDLSHAAAKKIGMINSGIAEVSIEIISEQQ